MYDSTTDVPDNVQDETQPTSDYEDLNNTPTEDLLGFEDNNNIIHPHAGMASTATQLDHLEDIITDESDLLDYQA